MRSPCLAGREEPVDMTSEPLFMRSWHPVCAAMLPGELQKYQSLMGQFGIKLE
jgi:hypothetical protein